ncbi:uncharacterized protein LOC126896913 [Daktulosphaira vitifoliae]|uniref:uncharacterized protein LOC126896913 n=1 Tax=Daktulosphaira vitifoliae TaxID=58002 RepID=UPI0021AA9F95|nr:uncharacterized protein LOC126896913 [Daktulosphaira vitifoliae]
MRSYKWIFCVTYLVVLFTFVQCENCTVKKISNGIINRFVILTCPSPEVTADAKFCCYDSYDNVECCNVTDRIHNLVQKYTPSLLILLILVIGLLLTCCVICICIPCYCMMKRRQPAYKDNNDNANMIAAVTLSHESDVENTPKKEVTHHLPPGAYPVYPQFMGMQPLKSNDVNC